MSLSIDIRKVDYIALCPGYTDRLLHDENTYETIKNANLLNKIRKSNNFYNNYKLKYGYDKSKPSIKKVTTKEGPELRFWNWGYTTSGLETERLYKADIVDCPCYEEEGFGTDYETEGNDINEMADFMSDRPYAKPIMIVSSDVYILETSESETIINSFYPKYIDELHGSIIFGPNKNKTLELVDWVELAKSINIDFCACYDPSCPYMMEIVHSNNKTILIVTFDCESG